MTPPHPTASDSDDHRPEHESDPQEFEQSLQAVEENLRALRQRYTQIVAAEEQRSELRARYNRTQNELKQHRTNQLQAELKDIQKQLEKLEIILESQLFSWSSLKEPFWMAVRFGGLGVVMGWIIRAIATA